MKAIDFEGQQVSVALHTHTGDDDLLSAGLGLSGLQAPMSAVAGALDWAARRRRAIHANWQGIAHLAEPDPQLVSALAHAVGGRELHARLQGAAAPAHRVMLQIPEHFDPRNPRLLVTASSGSRGIFGALAVAGPWALPRGWAVVYTDKGCGTDWFDVDSQSGCDLLGELTDDPRRQLFRPATHGLPPHSVLIPHAHSGRHPEAYWGEHVREAARFGWAALDALYPGLGPGQARHRRCLAIGLSNGGAAVLRAIETPGLFDGAVALAPNVLPAAGGRAFLDYAAEAALWLPLALQLPEFSERVAKAQPFAPLPLAQLAESSRRALRALGEHAPDPRRAYRQLRRRGWPAHTVQSALLSTLFDFWYAAGHTYAPALSRSAPGEHPLGSHFATLGIDAAARTASAEERALWWSDSAGIVPGVGVGIIDPRPRDAQLVRLHRLLHGAAHDRRIAAGIRQTRCAPPAGVPLVLIHGRRDGLIAPAFSSEPYARMARSAGASVLHWQPERAPHFDAFLSLPGYRLGLEPLLPYAAEALDHLERVTARTRKRTPTPSRMSNVCSRV